MTEEENEALKRLSKAALTMDLIEEQLNRVSKEHGYESFEDFKEKTGWNDRFVVEESC